MPDVDAIVVNWNGRDQTPQAVDSLLAQGGVRVIVVDNGSTDGSAAFFRERYDDRITLVETGENLGFGAGVNRGASVATAPFLLLLNPDAALHADSARALLHFMQSRPQCAIAGPKILEPDGRVAQSCGEFDTWTGAFLRSSAWGEWPVFRRFANGASLRDFDYNSPRRVDLVIGAAMMIRASVFRELGGFDERYFMYHEEVDLAKRVADAGYETWFVPSAVATHIGMGSTGPSTGSGQGHKRNVEQWKTRSRRLYWIKHHGHAWYYALSAALVARYVFYAAILAAIGYGVKRLLFR